MVSSCVDVVAINTLPKKPKGNANVISYYNSVKVARTRLVTANRRYEQHPSTRNKETLGKACKNLEDVYDNATADYIPGKIDNNKHLRQSNQRAAAWKTINDITCWKAKSSAIVKEGTRKKRLEGWLTHFDENLLGEPSSISANIPKIQIVDHLNIKTSPFTLKELLVVISELASKKSPGPDNIPPMIWKVHKFHPMLLEICHDVFTTYEAPPFWLTSNITPIPKKGNLTLSENYRWISILADS